MISLLLISLILVSIVPLHKNTIFNLALSRIVSIILIFSSFLIMNIYYIDRIYSGVHIFYGYISINSINQVFQFFLLLIGALISVPGSVLQNNKLIQTSNLIFQNVHPYLNNYGLIILFNLIGACALITANDMLTLYIAIETQSFSLYLLSTLKNDSIRSATAGLKYFLIGSLASIIILLGIALLYYASGLTNFENLALYFNITDFNPYYSTLILSIGFILIGLLIKVGAAPLHQWTPDVYSLVPTAVTTWLVVLPKLSIFVLLLQIIELILLGSITIQNLLIIISILSLIIGAIGGLYQVNIKRLLAYSSINNLGFLIIALTISNKVSLEAFTFYLTQYTFTTLNIFLILIAFGYLAYLYPIKNNRMFITQTKELSNSNLNVGDQTQDINFINQLTGLFKNNPILTISFIICLFSFAGVPPLMGFFAKQQVLLASLSVGFIFLSLIAINTSVIAAFYYLKLIQVSSFINNDLSLNLQKKFFKNTDKLADTLSKGVGQGISKNFFNSNSNISHVHSYLISILTCTILLYAIKPTLLLNLTSILAFYAFSI
ncbi:NADH-ubiquinone oxidoreductase chain 2 (mitochondrion) [Serendipita indica DSM 11827]|uniref:NADH-ubiquinone oxidoreductase chain 2 n=1 Tax=Serendipita indica (strain DSM 11827) TaxID=1109443 RepID=G4U3E4_SERID|nr:NADH-ubiquinone oxidoreductase chain 2 [Serendipita indica DSM 11827]